MRRHAAKLSGGPQVPLTQTPMRFAGPSYPIQGLRPRTPALYFYREPLWLLYPRTEGVKTKFSGTQGGVGGVASCRRNRVPEIISLETPRLAAEAGFCSNYWMSVSMVASQRSRIFIFAGSGSFILGSVGDQVRDPHPIESVPKATIKTPTKNPLLITFRFI